MNHYDEQSDDYTPVSNTFKWSVLNCDKEPVNVASTYNSVIGYRQTQYNNVVLQITGQCQQQVLGVQP